MATGDQYRVKAADMYGKVKDYSDPSMRAHFENLALSYLRLAEQADRRGTYEHPGQTQPTHQQQQAQGTHDSEPGDQRVN
jgi:hypothetical protein